ncbi:hypothetical protein MASR2M117_25560 [Paludibacter sp.]
MLLQAQVPNRTVKFSSPLAGVDNYNSISEALANITSPTTIWVAIGNYAEDELIIPANAIIIGGFHADATSINHRVYPGNSDISQQSVLSGSYEHRVATVHGTLDGFVITKGYVFDSIANSMKGAGGGVMIDGGTVINCIIHNNVASELAPSPSVIPGNFIASIGDIYMTDGTILKPEYTLNAQGKVIASLDGGIPSGKTVQGIVFYVDPSPTNNKFYVMAKVSSSNKLWFNPPIDVPGISNLATEDIAKNDFNGKANTDSLIAYVPRWLAANGNPWHNTDYAAKFARNYNTPAGTLGEWHLPSGGELYRMWEVHPQMEACARDILGWTTQNSPMFSKGFYVSSTEFDGNQIWALDTYSYPWGGWGLKKGSKTQNGIIVPITVKSLNQN